MMTEPNSIVADLLDTAPDAPAPEPEKVTPAPAPEQPEVVAEPQPEAEPEAKAETLKEYAARTGVKIDDLYALKTSSGMSLSELSDRGKDLDQLDVSVTEHERVVAQFRTEQLQFNQQVSDWAQLVQAGQDAPEALQRLQLQRTEQAEAARVQTLELIPEWKDAEIKTRDRQRIGEFISHFGFTAQEAENIADPRTHLMMRYVLTLDERFKSALASVKAVKNKTAKAPSKARPTANTIGLSDVASAMLEGLNNG